jgi:pilus assembly protein CpaB
MRVAINRSWLLLGVALVLGGLSAFGVKRYIEQHVEAIEARSRAQRTVKVVVPKEDLAKGTLLQVAHVAVREVPQEWAHSNAITPEQFDRVEGQALAYPVTRGEMLLWSLLEGGRSPSFSARLPAGQRGITVTVDEVNSISGLLQPGDRIDLMVTVKHEQKSYLFPLLQNVTVLATGAQAVPAAGWDGKDGSKRSFSTVTLETSPEDGRRVIAAREVGKLTAMLRAPGDKAELAATRSDAMTLLGLGGPAMPDERVPVIYGGAKLRPIPPLGHAPAAPALAPARP